MRLVFFLGIVFSFLWCPTIPALAADKGLPNESLQQFLSQATKIAVSTRLNIDQVPTAFTILDRQMIIRTGAVTVADLLRFVPGIEVIREGNGSYHVIIRGNYSDRRVLILWDGQPLNVLLTRRALQFIGYLPVDILERVEIIRGPSSSVYGSYAVGGVINLVPRKWANGGEGGGAYGSYDSRRVFVTGGVKRATYSLQFSSGAVNSRGEHFTATDAVGESGPVSLNYDCNWQEFRVHFRGLGAHLFRFDMGIPHYYGISDRLSRGPDPKTRIEYLGGELTHDLSLTQYLRSHFYLRWRQDRVSYGTIYMTGPDDPVWDLLGLSTNGQPILTQEGNREREISFGFWTSWYTKTHDLKIGLDFMQNKILSSFLRANISFPNPAILPTLETQPPPWPRVAENMWALYLQDEWQIDSTNELNFGLRFDKYQGFTGEFSPRLVWIHRFSEALVSKLIYGHGFRVPDLDALYDNHYPFVWGNPHLRPEKLDSIETLFIFRPTFRQRFSFSIFRMWLRDVLDRRIPGGIGGWTFQQGGNEDVWGGELSWRYKGNQWDLYCFGSYQWGTNEFHEPRPYVANILSGGVVSYSFSSIPLELDFSFNYVGPRWREKYNLTRQGIYVPDIRKKLKGYFLANFKLRYFLTSHIICWFDVVNIFDNDIRYPSTYIDGLGVKDDYRDQGRYFEFGLRFSF